MSGRTCGSRRVPSGGRCQRRPGTNQVDRRIVRPARGLMGRLVHPGACRDVPSGSGSLMDACGHQHIFKIIQERKSIYFTAVTLKVMKPKSSHILAKYFNFIDHIH